jgi:hypothetical protein
MFYMNETGSFYAPEKTVEIKNLILRKLVLEAIQEKNADQTLLIDNEKIVFPLSKYSLKQMKQYQSKLINWAIDPINTEIGAEGYALEILLKIMLKETLKENKKIIIFQSPATMDFIDGKDNEGWGLSSDIIVGKKLKNGIEPIILVNASMSHSESEKTQKKLKVPIITISGGKLFEGNEQFYLNLFAVNPEPEEFGISLAQRPPSKKSLNQIKATVEKQLFIRKQASQGQNTPR